eukprot:5613805-Pleurochrysis_carterae.AAC.1
MVAIGWRWRRQQHLCCWIHGGVAGGGGAGRVGRIGSVGHVDGVGAEAGTEGGDRLGAFRGLLTERKR